MSKSNSVENVSNQELIQEFLQWLQEMRPLSTGARSSLLRAVTFRRYTLGQLVPDGECTTGDFCYIARGAVKMFTIEKAAKADKEVEVPTRFFREQDILFPGWQKMMDAYSPEFIMATKQTILLVIDYDQYNSILQEHDELNYHVRLIAERNLCQLLNHMEILKKKSALERYRLLLQNFPLLVTEVKDEDLAGFIGLEPTYFSKIKAAFARK